MRRRHQLALHADANLNDAITTTNNIDTALDNIDTAKNGLPTSTPGANPETAPTGPSNSTQDITPDKAVADEKALRKAITAANKHLAVAAQICVRWATPNDTTTPINQRLTTIDALVWCENHLKHYMRVVRRPGHPDCDYCTQFRTQYKRTAPIEVLDHRARYGRLTETQTRRLIAKADARIAEERRTRKAAARAEQKENSVA